MQIDTLKYLAEIARTGSINQAARNLFVSQPHLSRILKDIEQTSNVVIFQRTNKGVELTREGQQFMAHVYRLLEEYQDLEDTFFNGKPEETVTLKVATQRYSPVISAFLEFYKKYTADTEYLNLALYEDTTENIIRLVSEQIYNVGVVHVMKSNVSEFLNTLKAHAAGVGGHISGLLGGKTDNLHGEPIMIEDAVVCALSDGQVCYNNYMVWRQRNNYGKSARIRVGNVEIVVTEIMSQQTFDNVTFSMVGADIDQYRYVGVKSAVHFHAYFDKHAIACICADSPGINTCHLEDLNLDKIRRPIYPLDEM